MAKQKYPKIVVGPCVVAFTYLDKPDTGNKFSDDKFKATLVFDSKAELKDAEKAAKEAQSMEWGKKIPKGLLSPFINGDDTTTEDFAGKVIIRAKSKFEPTLIDAMRQPLPDGVTINSGDLVKASLIAFPYTNGKNKGVTFQLRGVQLLEKRSGFDATDDFDDEENYATPETAGGGKSGGDADDF
jgi:hypothetical protein